MALNIIWHFWLSDCAPLPASSERLYAIAHAQRPTWAAHWRVITAIVADVAPELLKRFETHHKRRANLKRISQRGASMTALNSLRRKATLVDVAAPIAPTARQAKPTPAPMPRDGEGFVDRIRR